MISGGKEIISLNSLNSFLMEVQAENKCDRKQLEAEVKSGVAYQKTCRVVVKVSRNYFLLSFNVFRDLFSTKLLLTILSGIFSK